MWLRIDDHEVLDVRVGKLSDTQYRERLALMQWVAREHPGPGGIFPAEDVAVGAGYATPAGLRSVSAETFSRLVELGLVRDVLDYSEAELRVLEAERTNKRVAYGEAAEAIRAARSIVGDSRGVLYRFNRWEAYNGPRDRTAAERQRRRYENLTREKVDGSRVPLRAISRPVTTKPPNPVDADARARALAALLSLLGPLDETRLDVIRGESELVPADELERVVAAIGSGVVVDPPGYALAELRRLRGA